MKYVLTISLICILAAACNGSHVRKSITDDGKTMTIKVDVKNMQQEDIDYEQTFDVSNMSKNQKKALENRVYDSLGINH